MEFLFKLDVNWWRVLEQALQVLAAVIVGASVGYEREIKSKPAGFLTFTLVCVGSCLIAILQQNVTHTATTVEDSAFQAIVKVDQGRIIAQVVSGIGFLGAGTIIHTKASVKGITTAALLWVVAALGLLIGTGGIYNYIAVLVTVIIVLPFSYLSRHLSDKLIIGKKVHRVDITFEEAHEEEVLNKIKETGATIRKTFLVNTFKQNDVQFKELIVYLSVPSLTIFDESLTSLASNNFVYKVEEL